MLRRCLLSFSTLWIQKNKNELCRSCARICQFSSSSATPPPPPPPTTTRTIAEQEQSQVTTTTTTTREEGIEDQGKEPSNKLTKKLEKLEKKLYKLKALNNKGTYSSYSYGLRKQQRGKKNEELLQSVSHSLGVEFLHKYASSKSTSPTAAVEELLPFQCKKASTNIPTTLYLVDRGVAGDIVKLVKQDNPNLLPSTPVVELAPGLGILTKRLLQEVGVRHVTCLEESGRLSTFLKDSRGDFADSELTIIEKGFPEFPKLHHADKLDGGSRVANLLSQVAVGPPVPALEKQNLLVFGAFPHQSLINFTVRSLATGRVLYDEDLGWKDPIYYIALGSKAEWILLSGRDSGYFRYRPSTVVFQNLFKCTVLGEFPRTAWVPWTNEKRKNEEREPKYRYRNAYNPEIIYFVKIETRDEVVRKIGRENLVHFWYFVRQHLFSRKKCVVPELEKWVPGCGKKLIKQGFSIYTRFGELTPQEILDLYLQFTNWPEFDGSSFNAAVEKFQARLDLHDDEVQ